MHELVSIFLVASLQAVGYHCLMHYAEPIACMLGQFAQAHAAENTPLSANIAHLQQIPVLLNQWFLMCMDVPCQLC